MLENEKNRIDDEELENVSGGVGVATEVKSCPFCGSSDVTQSKVSEKYHCFACNKDFTVEEEKSGKSSVGEAVAQSAVVRKKKGQVGVVEGATWIQC